MKHKITLHVLMALFAAVMLTSCASIESGGNMNPSPKKNYRPASLTVYESSNWGQGAWAGASLLAFPAIALLTAPGCETYAYFAGREDNFFFSPVKSYRFNPYTRYTSDKFLIQPIYYTLSIPLVPCKHIYDLF